VTLGLGDDENFHEREIEVLGTKWRRTKLEEFRMMMMRRKEVGEETLYSL
jgi:hypothetical protein